MLERFLGRRKPAGPGVGEPAPDFSLPAIDGGTFALSEEWEKGPLVIAFFKITCPTCQLTFPFLERMHRSHEHDPVSFWGISQNNAEKSQLFRERFSVTFPVAIDAPGYSASKQYHFNNVPTILLIDREGTIRFRQSGFTKAGLIELSERIGSLLGRAPETVFLPTDLVPALKPG